MPICRALIFPLKRLFLWKTRTLQSHRFAHYPHKKTPEKRLALSGIFFV